METKPYNPNGNYNGGKQMDSSLNATEIAVGSLLAGGRGYGGYGAWGGGYGGVAPFAGPASNAVRLDRNAQAIEDQADCTRSVLGIQMDSTREAFTTAQNNNQFTRVCDRLSDLEFRTSDRLRDIEREMNANARAAADCCCRLERQACEDKAEILAAIQSVETRRVRDDLDQARSRINQLEIFSTCGCGCGGGVKPCP